ncbi:hypothetical protein [Virgisporangium ochraceum]|nr:hypothetical protein [Virgisporangium ochraceum]
MTEPLLGDDLLWRSDVVANCAMNRSRQASTCTWCARPSTGSSRASGST